MANATQNTYKDGRTYGVSNDRLQKRAYFAEAGVVPNGDTLEVIHPDFATEGGFPVLGASAYSHDGGMATTATASHVTSNGDTIVLEFDNPHERDRREQFESEYVEVVHVLSGVSAGAATAAEIVSSLNSDSAVREWGYAAVSATNVVRVYPHGADGHVRIGNGSTSVAAGTFGIALRNNARTYTELDPSEWLLTHTPADGKVSVANSSGGPVSSVIAAVSYF